MPKFVSEMRGKIHIVELNKKHDTLNETLANEDKAAKNKFDDGRIKCISIGMGHGALITCNGSLYTWGVNMGGGYLNDNDNKQQVSNIYSFIIHEKFRFITNQFCIKNLQHRLKA